MTKPWTKPEYNPLKDATVFTANHSEIERTGSRQCETHTWRKLNDTEIGCTRCMTVNIVANANDYVN